MSARRDVARARGLYRAFREDEPGRIGRARLRIPKAVALMGPVEFIGYVTTHRGQVALYIHEFAPGSRPLMYAGAGRGQLYLLGGRFKVTGRGITDLSALGREVHARRRFEVKLRKGR